jgi:hypothetical protein
LGYFIVQNVQGAVDDVGDAGIAERVMDMRTLALHADDMVRAKQGEVLGDVRRRDAEGIPQTRHVLLPLMQEGDNPQPSGMRQNTEKAGHILDDTLSERHGMISLYDANGIAGTTAEQ